MKKLLLKFIKEIKYLLLLKPTQNAIWNLLAYFIVILCGVITSSILTNNITPNELGIIGLITTIIGIISSFIGFGYFEGYYLVLINQDKKNKQRELIGTGIIILLIIILIFFIITLLSTPIIYLIYKDKRIIDTLIYINFISCFSISNIFVIITIRSIGRMTLQALFSIFSPTLYLILLIILLKYNLLNYNLILIINYISIFISFLLIIFFIKPKFKNIKTNFLLIKDKQRKQGFDKYIGQSFERITYQLDKFILGIYNYSNIAYYGLGLILVSPISIFSSKLTDSLLKDFNKQNKISNKIFFYNFLWWLFCSIILILIIKRIILFLWTEQYLIIIDFIYLLLLISLIEIFYYILFSFLSLKGINKNLKKYFFLRGICNLFGNILLIPMLGIKGALISTILGNSFFLGGIYYEYKKLIGKIH